MRALCLISALMVVGMMCAPAFAQLEARTPTGSHIQRKPQKADADESADFSAQVAGCMYRQSRETVEAFLRNSDPMTDSLDPIRMSYKEFSDEVNAASCMARSMSTAQAALSMSLQHLRAKLAGAAYLENVDVLPADWTDEILPAFERRFFSEGAALTQAKAAARFSDCIVEKAPLQADAFLRTQPGSDSDKAALADLIPFLGPCVVAGQTLELTPTALRAFVADGLWTRWSATQQLSGG